MDNDSLKVYLVKVVVRSIFSQQKRLLVWDSVKAYTSAVTKQVFKQLNLEMAVVPGGCTPFVQASVQETYDEWVLPDDHPTTSGGNPKAPPMELYLQWIKDAWNALSEDTVARSFKASGITTDLDGTEDDMIVSLKPDGDIPNGLQLLANAPQAAEDTDAADELALLVENVGIEEPQSDDSDASLEV
ncbi:pogo transposable element with KRAB domain-like protein [Aphelenchoides avenae]|nr:pogo transposable element with KRAB domain-like protein [Aphelenchus avenae]